MPTTLKPTEKKPTYTGRIGSTEPSAVHKPLSFKVEEEDKGAEEEEREQEDEGEFLLGEEDDQMDYQNEILDTQDEEATFIRIWETANLL